MTTDNMALWNAANTTDMRYTKHITIPYDHTDINATYFFQRATEVFGPLGIGWGYAAGEPKREGQLVSIRVDLWYVWQGQRSEPFAIYGSKPVRMSNKPDKTDEDDEAVKKAVTDALKKGLSMLGICSDIFLGEREGDDRPGKSERKPPPAKTAPRPAPPKPSPPADPGDIEDWRKEPLGFGKHKAVAWFEVEKGYLEWMVGNTDDGPRRKKAEAELEARTPTITGPEPDDTELNDEDSCPF